MAARRAPGVITKGTAQDQAALGVGFSASGASEFSRQAAHGGNVKTKSYVEPPAISRHITKEPRAVGVLIGVHAQKLAALHMRLRTEKDAERCDKIRSDIERKTKFLERLKAEARQQ